MIVIGSQALSSIKDIIPQIESRIEKADFDVVMTENEFFEWNKEYDQYIKSIYPTQSNKYKVIVVKDNKRRQYEIEIGVSETSAEYLLNHKTEFCNGIRLGFFGEIMEIAKPEILLLTKKSHLIYPVHFEKNIEDYHVIKNTLGDFDISYTQQKYFDLRKQEAKDRYKQKTPKLNVTNEDFFSSKLKVERYFIHDDIHEMVKHYDRPIYEMMKRDFSLAKCEKDMFFSLPFSYQIQCVQEEAYTIALERYIVPQDGEDWNDYFNCYKKAVKRICTTLCSGWFREFAIENYPEVIKQYNPEFVNNFKAKFDQGQIVPVEGKTINDVPRFWTQEAVN